MKILSLDLGTTTGWALKTEDKIISGSISFKDNEFDSKHCKYTKFSRWLNTIYRTYAPDFISYEAVRRHLGTTAAHVYGGFMAALHMFSDNHDLVYEGVPVQTIKKFITGKGNAGKEEVINAIKAKGHMPKDDNEADALALLYWNLQQAK